MKRRYEHLIFDLDGTLIDSAPDIAIAVNKTLSALGFPAVTESEVRCWVGQGVNVLFEKLFDDLSANGRASDVHELSPFVTKNGPMIDEFHQSAVFKKAIELFFHYYKQVPQKTALYDGVYETLTQLKEGGFTLTLCTNKPLQFLPSLLDFFNIHTLFSEVVGGDSFAHKKPHPEPLIWLCQKTGYAINQSLMMGDSMNDVMAAKQSGMDCVCFDYGYNGGVPIKSVFSGPILSRFPDILSLVK